MPNALSRKKDYRNSLVRNLATSLVLYEKIKTTKAKAKEVKPVVEHLITIGKKNDLNARRILGSFFFDENAVKKTLEVLVPRYKKINSGFIKTYKLGTRLGDNAEMILLELIPGKAEKEDATYGADKKTTPLDNASQSNGARVKENKDAKPIDKAQGKESRDKKVSTKARSKNK